MSGGGDMGRELDETQEMPKTSDPGEQQALLVKLQTHGGEIAQLRERLDSLRTSTPGTVGVAELRTLVEDAEALQQRVDVPRDLLTRDLLEQVQFPVEELEQARGLVSAVAASERSTEEARQQIGTEQCQASAVQALAELLETWSQLKKLTTELKKQEGSAPASSVDVGMKQRAATSAQVATALLDKLTVESEHVEQLRELCSKDPVRHELAELGVDVPADLATPEAGSGSRGAASAAEEVVASQGGAGSAGGAGLSELDGPTLPQAPSMSMSRPSGSAQPFGGSIQEEAQNAEAAPLHGSPELWQAVHVGDEAAIRSCIQQGLCNGRSVDASGHSLLWHALAFNHLGLAKLLLEAFPPDSSGGVDVEEVHQRKGDTLLHALCAVSQFNADAAFVFAKVSRAAPEALFTKVNAQGLTFFHLACRSLNFWVLKFVCLNFPGPAKRLTCSPELAPLRLVAEVIPTPSPPSFTQPEPLPPHFAIARLLQNDGAAGGAIPYADVAFDVGPEEPGSDDSVRGRFLAHRIVVGAQSAVLMSELERLPLQPLSSEGISACILRVDPRISKEVWRCALQFFYTGHINCPFQEDANRMVDLLQACALYQLPPPLLEYAQAAVFHLLPGCPPAVALQVFSIVTAGPCGDDVRLHPLREASSYILLKSAPQTLEALAPAEVSKILDRMLQTVETSVFEHPAAASQAAPEDEAAAAAAAQAAAAAAAQAAAAAAALQQPLHSQQQSLEAMPTHPSAAAAAAGMGSPYPVAYAAAGMPYGADGGMSYGHSQWAQPSSGIPVAGSLDMSYSHWHQQ